MKKTPVDRESFDIRMRGNYIYPIVYPWSDIWLIRGLIGN